MSALRPPSLTFKGTCWSSDALAAMAGRWAEDLAASLAGARASAMVMDNHPESVALFYALSCGPVPVVLLPPDLRPWRSTPPLPSDTRVVVSARQRAIAGEARALGLDATVVPEPTASDGPRAPAFMTMPGVVLFTSGSTGGARPVFRPTSALLATSRALIASLGLTPGSGVVTTLPLGRAFGLHHGLVTASLLGGRLGLMERFEHTALLRLFASRDYVYWPGMPAMADVLGRCALVGPAEAPPICLMGARVSPDVADRFRSRFGVPLRQGYGTTESGGIAVDGSAAGAVRSQTVGRPMGGVEVRIGADPAALTAPGLAGRIWVRSPALMMGGYGFPPDLEPPETVDGWWATPDVGWFDGDGYLTISGRVDDTFRTSSGHLVNPGSVAAAIEHYPGVSDSAVVSLATVSGPLLGVLVAGPEPLRVDDLRQHLADALPAWSQPRVIRWTSALPRLAAGKVDRRACIAMLEQSLGVEDRA